MIKLPMPAWAFDYNQSYGTYSNTGNASVYYPSYSAQSMNSYINKSNMPAFVRNARTGCCGNGMVFYGYPPAYNMYKELTHVWAMAIPITMGWPIGICTLNISMGLPYPPNFDAVGQTFMMNTCLYIDNDHRLKYGHQYSSTSIPPNMVYDYGIDMTPYMYTPAVQNADPYCGHMYAFTYNTEAEEYELYVDNMNTKLATINKLLMTECVLNYMNSPDYTAGVPQHLENVIYNGYYYTGPGAYMYNDGNVNRQGNVYMSDWYGWLNSFNSTTIDAVMQFNWKQMLPVKNNNYYGAFGYCNQLRHIIVPGTLKNIPNYFINGNNLNSITFQEGVNLISSYAVDCFSSVGCTVNIPKSAHIVGAWAVRGSNINVPKFTRNAPMLNSMFNKPFDGSEYNFYEQPTQLVINDSPLRQLRPTNYMLLSGSIYMPFPSAYCTPENIANDMYNVATGINVQQKQAYITQDGDSYALSWHNIHAEILFDDPNVARGPHTNAVMFTPYNMTNEGFDVQIRSLEFHSLMAESHCTIINSPFVITNINDSLRCTVVGCTSGDITEIPDIIDNAYFVEAVQLGMPYPSGEVDPQYTYGAPIIPDISMKVPNAGVYPNGSHYTGQLNLIINSAQIQNMGHHNIHIHDGFVFNTNVQTLSTDPVYDLYVNNVDRVIITGSPYNNSHIFINNCNHIVINTAAKMGSNANSCPLDTLMESGNVIVMHGNYTANVNFAHLNCFNFPYVRSYYSKQFMTNLFTTNLIELINDKMPDYILGWTDTEFYPHLNDSMKETVRNVWSFTKFPNTYQSFFMGEYNGASIADLMGSMGGKVCFNNCILPPNIYLSNGEDIANSLFAYNNATVQNRYFAFNACSGDCNFYINGYQIGLPMIADHNGTINIFLDVDLLPMCHYKGGRGVLQYCSQLFANNCNINVLRMHVNSHIPENSGLQNRADLFVFGVTNCNIDTLVVDEPNIFYHLSNCNVNHIQYSGGPVRGLLFNANTIVNDYIQPVLENTTHFSALSRVMVPDYNITIYKKRPPLDDSSSLFIEATEVYCNGTLRVEFEYKEAMLPGSSHTVHVHSPKLFINNIYSAGMNCSGWNVTTPNYIINRYPDLHTYVYTYNNIPRYTNKLPEIVSVKNAYEAYMYFSAADTSYPDAYREAPFVTGLENVKVLNYTLGNMNNGIYVVSNKCILNGGQSSCYNVAVECSGTGYATGIEVTYKDNTRVRTLTDGFCNLYDYIDTVSLTCDGRAWSIDKNDCMLIPPFASIRPGTTDLNAKHFICAGGIIVAIDAPYTRVNNYGNPLTKAGHAIAVSKYNACNYNGDYYQQYTAYPPVNGFTYINATPSSATASYAYQYIMGNVNSGVPIEGIVLNGAYNAWGRVYANYIVSLNQSTNGWSDHSSGIYAKDSCACFRPTWASSGTYRTQYTSSTPLIVDFSNSTAINSAYALGNNSIRNCYSLRYILCQVGNKSKYIANNSVFGCDYLEHVEMNYINSTTFRINDDAFRNCPLLQEVWVPRNTNYIGNGAFNRTGLKRIVVPSTCTFGTNAVPADCQISYY